MACTGRYTGRYDYASSQMTPCGPGAPWAISANHNDALHPSTGYLVATAEYDDMSVLT